MKPEVPQDEWTQFMRELIGDAAALQDIYAALKVRSATEPRLEGVEHVSWTPSWVNSVAELSSPERELEIERGIDGLVKMYDAFERGEYTIVDELDEECDRR